MQKQVKIEFSAEAVNGVAILEEKQINALTFNAGIVRLRDDLIYVVPRQWVHSEKLLRPFNGHDSSNKVFILGVDPTSNSIVTVTTIAINTLSSSYYGDVTNDPDMKISAVINNDLHRAPKGTSMYSVFDNGGISFLSDGKKLYVSQNMAFTVGKRHQVWIGSFKNLGSSANPRWDMEWYEEGGQQYLKLAQTSMNRFSETVIPEYEFSSEAIGSEHFDLISKYLKDLPTA